MILELDVGNSRIKWRLLQPDTGPDASSDSVTDLDELDAALAAVDPPDMVRVCSVRGGDITDALAQRIRARWNLQLQLATVTRSCGGVTNQYADLSKLGIDRWLAMLAAFNRSGGACIVIDSGTACTIDVIDGVGLHQGGYITPGLKLMRNSLENNTRIRLSEERREATLALGHSTDSAVCNGVLAQQIALIRQVIVASRGTNPETAVFLTGGDAKLIARYAGIDNSQIVSSLVLDGLGIACPFPQIVV